METGQDWKIAALTINVYVRYFYGVKYMYSDEYFMDIALKLAEKAFYEDEIPVGAVIVRDNKIISKAYNKKDTTKLVSKHAEMIAIEKANKKLKDWRLNDCTIYVTLEPCPMCAGAIQQSRINRVVYGCAANNKYNSDIIFEIFKNKQNNHQVSITSGVLNNKCSNLIKLFFKNKR